MKADKQYIIQMRRQLHQIPEIGYDLPKTLALIRRELDAMGLPYTEEYGTSSIIATLNEGVGNKTIALRADTDALPVQEETGLEFASTHPGKMHACGHDCHTAMLLGTAKVMSENADKIKCCVKFVFQASEEGPSGAKRICEDGFMDQVDMIIGCHIVPDKPAGWILTNKTCCNAGSHGFKIFLEGKSCHVARPQQGVDAIAMAARVYTDIQIMRARELDPFEPVVIGIGEIHGGNANNVVCDQVMMHGTIRTQRDEVDKLIYRRIEEIAQNVARDMGGTARVETSKYNPALRNDHYLADAIWDAGVKVVGAENVREKPLSMGAEDFSHYTYYKPGAMFNLGVMPADGNFAPLHNGKMLVNEDVLDVTPNLFIQFVLDQMEK
jgi:amidohydrolase